jgi:hypothetical protein
MESVLWGLELGSNVRKKDTELGNQESTEMNSHRTWGPS